MPRRARGEVELGDGDAQRILCGESGSPQSFASCFAAAQPALPCAVVRAGRSHPDSPWSSEGTTPERLDQTKNTRKTENSP